MLKEFKTYKRRIGNIFENQKANIPQLEFELKELITKAKEKQNQEWVKSNGLGDKYWGNLADSGFDPTYQHLKNKVNASSLLFSDELKLYIELL